MAPDLWHPMGMSSLDTASPQLQVRVTKDQKRAWDAAAKLANLRLSTWVKAVCDTASSGESIKALDRGVQRWVIRRNPKRRK